MQYLEEFLALVFCVVFVVAAGLVAPGLKDGFVGISQIQ